MPNRTSRAPQEATKVARLSLVNQPHSARTSQITEWHAARADGDADPTIAAVHLAITHAGRISTTLLTLEPVHAQIILAQLPALSRRLRAHSKQTR